MRRLRRRDNFDEIYEQMQSMVNQLQDSTLGMATSVPVDIEEENGTFILRADLPGVEKDEIDLKADKNEISITAESETALEEENEKYFKKERRTRAFQRTISWPAPVKPETIQAEYEDGVLEVTAEKQEDNGHDIEIK